MPKLPTPPRPPRIEEQIRPDALVRTIKQERPAAKGGLKDIPVTPENYKKFEGEQRGRGGLPRGIAWGIAGLVVLFVVGSVVSFYIAKEQVKRSIAAQAATLAAGVADLQNLDTQSAAQEFSQLAATSSMPSLENLFGMFGSFITGGRNAVASFGDLATQLNNLSQEANSLGDGVFNFATGSSTDLIAQLSNLRDTLAAIDADSNQLSGALSSVGAVGSVGSPDSLGSAANVYLPLKARVEGAENFLNVFIPWLATSTPHHVLVLLQNPSEMRPGGGFLGSYADVTIASGTIENVAVHDIADVDAGFAPKIIPPAPLQLEVKNFRPADANWFLDFPTSASETIQLFEESKLYGGSAAASSTTFDGVIAISPKVISDLLSITGPITIGKTSFTSDNLLQQIQNIVQQGQAQQQGGDSAATEVTYPKAVLGELSQAIVAELVAASSSTDAVGGAQANAQTSAQNQELFAMALDWVAKRDVVAYFNDPTMEGFVESYGAGGDVYQLPQNFNGDYLAIANTNINGDKSDLYVAQNVSFDAQIGADGTITDTLKISRTHNGNQSKNWWYQTTNQDYLQIFTPPGVALTNETGGVAKKIVPFLSAAQYANAGYSTDPMIAAIASTTQSFLLYPAVTAQTQDGKNVFTTWAITHAGATTALEFDYTHRAFIPAAPGVAYQFVFEKQAGFPVSGGDISDGASGAAGAGNTAALDDHNYDFEIDAPLGYIFAENGLATYEYQSDDLPGRLVVNLTLEKI